MHTGVSKLVWSKGRADESVATTSNAVPPVVLARSAYVMGSICVRIASG